MSGLGATETVLANVAEVCTRSVDGTSHMTDLAVLGTPHHNFLSKLMTVEASECVLGHRWCPQDDEHHSDSTASIRTHR